MRKIPTNPETEAAAIRPLTKAELEAVAGGVSDPTACPEPQLPTLPTGWGDNPGIPVCC
jgi:hypothetical protein